MILAFFKRNRCVLFQSQLENDLSRNKINGYSKGASESHELLVLLVEISASLALPLNLKLYQTTFSYGLLCGFSFSATFQKHRNSRSIYEESATLICTEILVVDIVIRFLRTLSTRIQAQNCQIQYFRVSTALEVDV